MISSSPEAGTQATKGRTVTITVSQGSEGIAVPKVVGLQRDEAEAQLESAGPEGRGHRAGDDAAARDRDAAGPVDGDPRRPRRDRPLTVAKARPEVPDVTGSTEEEATATLEQAGFKVQTREREDPTQVGRRRRPGPGSGHGPLQRGDDHDLRRHRPDRGHADADADAHAVRVAVLAGGRSSEHEVSLDLRRGRPRRARGRGPRGAAGDDRARRRLGPRGRSAVAGARAAACSAPTSSSRSCTGRSARTGRSRACSSCSTCPTSAPACSPPRCAWTRWSSRRCWPPRTSRRCPTRGCGSRAGAREPEAVRRELAVLGTPVFVKPARLGSSVGIAKVSSEAELGRRARRRVRARQPRDRRGLLGRHGGRVLRAGQRRARGLGPRRDRPQGRRLVRLRGQVHARRDGARRPGPARRPVREDVRRLAVDTFLRVGCAGLARVDFFVEDGSRVLVNELNTLPGFTATSVYPKLWEAYGPGRSRSCATACSALRSSASRPSARRFLS